jgi:hypothetical protein
MTRTPSHVLRLAIVLSTAVVVPLLVLELRNAPQALDRTADVWVLFALLWALSLGALVAALPLVSARGGASVAPRPLAVAARVCCVVVLAGMWLAIVADQWPCFMGASNCD